jgi:hypothetical protein
MSHLNLDEGYQSMNRVEVAAELRRLATQLEWHRSLPAGGGAIDIPYHLQREIEFHDRANGTAVRFEYRLTWTVHDDEVAEPEPTPSDATGRRDGQ